MTDFNIDAETIKNEISLNIKQFSKLVEMSNGCIFVLYD